VPDLLTQPATDLLALLASNKLSALELANQHIARIEHLNPLLNAIVDFNPEAIRAQALALDNTKTRGPLHGLPLTIKSSISVKDHLCETGSLLNKGRRPTEDAETVRRLRNAGALILGTTNCPEFLMAYETDNLLHGRTSNPWDLTRTPGGSSGGESAAIAAGLSAGGLGSDGGGSVRTPAHFTGRDDYLPWASRWLDAWETFALEAEAIEPVGEHHVLTTALQRGVGKGSGVEVEMRVYYLTEYRDGLATRGAPVRRSREGAGGSASRRRGHPRRLAGRSLQ